MMRHSYITHGPAGPEAPSSGLLSGPSTPACGCTGRRAEAARSGRGFTLLELMVVIAIIVLLAGISVPAIRSLTKSNDQSQATNLVRSMIAAARSVAISQHRMAGVVFFTETPAFSRPVNGDRTAMQIFVEDFNQLQWQQNYTGMQPGMTVFTYYSTARQYLPMGTSVVTLGDLPNVVADTSQSFGTQAGRRRTRAILFDANGQLVLRGGLTAPPPFAATAPGDYPTAYGDWQFLTPSAQFPGDGTVQTNPAGAARSSPGIFIFSLTDLKGAMDADPNGMGSPTGDQKRSDWLKQHADVVIINPTTGNVFR